RGWSEAENVSGSSDSDYSIYIDLVYSDGSPLWGQTAPFRTGSHDWQEREVVIVPKKPVKSLTVHCLFRAHSGRTWFDDVSVREMQYRNGALLFEGRPVLSASATAAARETLYQTLETQDGL